MNAAIKAFDALKELYTLNEFEAIAAWLEENLRGVNGVHVENVRFEGIGWHERLSDFVYHHAGGFNGKQPQRAPLADQPGDWFSGFYGEIIYEVLTRNGGVYIDPYKRDLFAPLLIHQINRSYLYSGGRVRRQYSLGEQPIFGQIIEQTERFRSQIFMFTDDWQNLADSFRVREILTQ